MLVRKCQKNSDWINSRGITVKSFIFEQFKKQEKSSFKKIFHDILIKKKWIQAKKYLKKNSFGTEENSFRSQISFRRKRFFSWDLRHCGYFRRIHYPICESKSLLILHILVGLWKWTSNMTKIIKQFLLESHCQTKKIHYTITFQKKSLLFQKNLVHLNLLCCSKSIKDLFDTSLSDGILLNIQWTFLNKIIKNFLQKIFFTFFSIRPKKLPTVIWFEILNR